MQYETRRSAREATASAAQRQSQTQRKSRRRVVWISLACVLVVLLGAAAWVGWRALTVKSELTAAQQLLTTTDSDVTTDQRISLLAGHAKAAADAAGDPVWRALEWVPIAGDNLRAVRASSEALDLLANDVAVPALAAVDGGTGSPLAAILSVAQASSTEVTATAATVSDAARSTWLIDPVRSGIDQVNDVMQTAAPVLQALPTLLGADGPKKYLLAFQNNAEVAALGGSAASQTLIGVDGGSMSIIGQAGSGNFTEGVPVDVAVDQSAIDLYTSYLVDHVNTTMSRPDFPTAAQLLRAFWQRDISNEEVNGVIAIDPIALGRILLSTGPITVEDVEITSKNAVSILLKDVYAWWNPYASKAQAAASDAFFASVASTVFNKIASGEFDIKDMLWAVNESISAGDIMMWTDESDLAGLLQGQRVAGVLPADNASATTVGVFFRDTSGSKIDYYMDSSVDLSRTCSDDGSTSFTAKTSLTLDISQADADALPAYVKSRTWGSTQFRTEVFVYGPPGTTFSTAEVDGREVSATRTDIDDLGRPVAAFQVILRPSESGVVTATFTGTGDFGPLALRATPMINPTDVAIADRCG